MTWSPLAVLPNIRLADSIDAASLSLAPFRDERVTNLRAQRPNFNRFLTSFKTQHATVVEPATMIHLQESENSQYNSEAMVAFRNAISISTILRSYVAFINHQAQHRIMHSDSFEFYGWMIDRNYEYLISLTPAQMAVHTVEGFSGQTSANLPLQRLGGHEIDRSLLQALLAIWEQAYARDRQTAQERALFRSLNMANAALAVPAAKIPTIFDYGRQCALWVSAFEILAHQFANEGRANFLTVRAMLEAFQLIGREIRARRFRILFRGESANVALPTKLYMLLYKARNDFLHGNEVNRSSIQIPWSGRLISDFAPLLYRCALRNFLRLDLMNEEAITVEDRRRESGLQFNTETAIMKARIPLEPEC